MSLRLPRPRPSSVPSPLSAPHPAPSQCESPEAEFVDGGGDGEGTGRGARPRQRASVRQSVRPSTRPSSLPSSAAALTYPVYPPPLLSLPLSSAHSLYSLHAPAPGKKAASAS